MAGYQRLCYYDKVELGIVCMENITTCTALLWVVCMLGADPVNDSQTPNKPLGGLKGVTDRPTDRPTD